MSRSIKKPIIKDKGYRKKDYWKTIRREWNKTLIKIKKVCQYKTEIDKNQAQKVSFKTPKAIINDYDYSDYRIYFRSSNKEYITKK